MSRSIGRLQHGLSRGFTIMELIVVISIAGVLAVVVLPKFDVASSSGGVAFRDSMLAGLRYARATALGHRRLVCININASSQLALTIAAANPATSCSNPLASPDGSSFYATPPNGVTATASNGGTIYVQPSGRFTSDGAGATGISPTIAITGQTTITLEMYGRIE